MRIRQLRVLRGVKVSELSRDLGIIGNDTIRKYERGEREPNIKTLIALADYFDVSIDYLVGRSDER